MDRRAASLTGKVALVTGGTRGIGRAIVEELGRVGADVAFGYRENRAAADEVLEQADELGVALEAICVDLSADDGPRTLVNRAVTRFGRLDVLVVNAGVWDHAPFLETSADMYDRLQRVNARASFFLIQEAAREMIDRGVAGKIVVITSRGRWRPRPGSTAYSTSKSALHSLAHSAAIELAPFGITVNEVAPGPIETEMNRLVRENPDQLKSLLDSVMLKRFGQPHEVATVVRFLVSEDASFVTGATLMVDGGTDTS